METIVQIMDITPGLAKAWLENSKFSNRRLSERNVNKIARDIKADKWVFDGTPIRFDEHENILDGQHRLWAISRSGKLVKSLVVTGLSQSSKDVIDTGKSRSISDVFHFNGHQESSLKPSLCRLVLGYKEFDGDMWKWSTKVISKRHSTQEILDEAETNKLISLACSGISRYKTAKKILGSSTAAMLYYIISTFCKDSYAIHEFFEGLDTGINLHPSSSILVLRNCLTVNLHQGSSAKLSGNKHIAYKLAISIKAWNSFAGGDPIKRLRFDAGHEYPRIFR